MAIPAAPLAVTVKFKVLIRFGTQHPEALISTGLIRTERRLSILSFKATSARLTHRRLWGIFRGFALETFEISDIRDFWTILGDDTALESGLTCSDDADSTATATAKAAGATGLVPVSSSADSRASVK